MNPFYQRVPACSTGGTGLLKIGWRWLRSDELPKKCFVIGPIGEVGSPIRDAADAFMTHIVEPTIKRPELGYGMPVQRADTLGEPGRITSQIITLLKEADLVIADLTGSNPNVYYELSLRHALGKPAIHMAADGTTLPFDIHDNRTIFYTMDIRRVNAACAELAQQVERVSAEGYKASNPITEAISIVELSQSHDPIQRTLSTVVQGLEVLSGEVRRLHLVQNLARFAELAAVPGMDKTGPLGFGSLGFATGKGVLSELLAAAAQSAADAADTPAVLKTARHGKREKPKQAGEAQRRIAMACGHDMLIPATGLLQGLRLPPLHARTRP